MICRTDRRLSARRAHGFGSALRASYAHEAQGQSLAALNYSASVLAFRQHESFGWALVHNRN